MTPNIVGLEVVDRPQTYACGMKGVAVSNHDAGLGQAQMDVFRSTAKQVCQLDTHRLVFAAHVVGFHGVGAI